MAKNKDNAQVILDDVLKQLHAERAPEMDESEYFEVFCAEQLLKDHDLSYEEIEDGIVDGEHDGGVDAVYSFVNGDLITEDFDAGPFKKDVFIELKIIQSKTSSNYSEATIDKLISITKNLLDLSKDPGSLTQYNEQVRAKIQKFRDVYRALASRFPVLSITYYLAGKRSNVAIPQSILTKGDELKEAAKSHFPGATVEVEILGAAQLMELARRQPKSVFDLKCVKSLGIENGAIVLSKLSDFNAFLRDEKGSVRKLLFESNVRDFQGTTEVNAAIRQTLDSETTPDFWWLNNGVTILASRSSIIGDTVSIADPQIVNGLQTSTQISQYFGNDASKADDRNVMIKIVSSDDDEIRDKIIKATNSQNPIQPATLRATDKVQRDIESTLKGVGLFYDRRKNLYKNEGKPADKIVSIPLMAQVLMSVLLKRPDDARARPSSLIKDDKIYSDLFSDAIPVQVYSFAGILIKRVESHLKGRSGLTARDRNNIRFYVAAYLVWILTKTVSPTPSNIAALSTADVTTLALTQTTNVVILEYNKLGSTDQAAKGSELKKNLTAIASSEIASVTSEASKAS
jgi:hypothetical protein